MGIYKVMPQVISWFINQKEVCQYISQIYQVVKLELCNHQLGVPEGDMIERLVHTLRWLGPPCGLAR